MRLLVVVTGGLRKAGRRVLPAMTLCMLALSAHTAFASVSTNAAQRAARAGQGAAPVVMQEAVTARPVMGHETTMIADFRRGMPRMGAAPYLPVPPPARMRSGTT
jgi:hypothetical protein